MRQIEIKWKAFQVLSLPIFLTASYLFPVKSNELNPHSTISKKTGELSDNIVSEVKIYSDTKAKTTVYEKLHFFNEIAFKKIIQNN